MLDFNTEPYNDDFDENNKFYRILFRPSFAVQARELTQLQSILQQQIARTGDHLFKQGAMVVPGQIFCDTNYNYVKLQTFYNSDVIETYIQNFADREIIGSSGVKATVLKVVREEGNDETTLYVRYSSSGTDTTTKTFSNNEVITTTSGTGTYTVQAIASNATGVGSAAIIQRGVYYVNGYFVLCDAQTIILDKYTNTPTYRVGLTINEVKTTPEDDETLLDNAQTSFNYAAPGAHRYYIDLVLTKIPLLNSAYTWTANTPVFKGDVIKSGNLYYQITIAGTTGSTAPSFTSGATANGTATLQYIQTYIPSLDVDSDSNFIELLSTNTGTVLTQVTETAYSQIEKTFARRTFDESGNYTVRPFKIDVREHRNNNRGAWVTDRAYLIGDVVVHNGITYVATDNGTSKTVPPVHTTGIVSDSSTTGGVLWEYNQTPFYNRGIYSPTDAANPGSDTKLAIGLEPGKAYIQGYEVQKTSTEYITIDKARDSVQVNNSYLTSPVGNFVYVKNINSLPPFDSTSGMPTVTLYNRFTYAVGTSPLGSVAATVAISGSAGQFTCGNSNLEVGDLITITGTKGGTSTFTGYTTGTTYKVSAVTGASPSVTGFTLTTTADSALSTSAGTLTGLTYTVTSVNAKAIGTARVRGIEWDNGTIGTQTAVYKLYLFDVNLTTGFDFARDVKSFFYSRSDTNLNFTADINEITTNLIGSGTTYSSYPGTRGASTTIYGVGTAFSGGTNRPVFSPALKIGDFIYVGSTANRRRVVTITNNEQITVDTAVTVDGGIISLIQSGVQEPQNDSLIYPLPNYAIKSVRAADNVTKNIIYYGMQYLTGSTGSGSGGSCTLPLTASSGVFADPAETDNYILVYNDSTAGGVIVNPTGYTSGGSSSITFTLPDTYASKDFIVMATIKKVGIGEKSKTLSSATVTLTTQVTATKSVLSLGKADILRIKSVMMDTGTFASPTGNYTVDISDRYDLDNGQRDTHYDIGKLLLKQSYAPPSAPIVITFSWFEHGTGDYFTKNSYPIDTTIKAVDVPSYDGNNLRDVLDFRPRIGDAGAVFTGGNASFSMTPKRGQDITLDYSYYLGRQEKIAIDFTGRFFNIKGVSALVPVEPNDPVIGMVLYKLNLEPFTFGTANTNVIVNQVDNKRYTMRDIGKLEKRIDNLEYYTSLSLLEQETKSLSITDSQGLERFKNGFIVDSFTGHNVGDVTSPDYLCSVDMEKGELRPFYSMNNINLVENKTNDGDRTTAGYKLYGDVITLPVKEDIPLITQAYASRLENVNPFAVFNFLGDIRLNPSSDDWFETVRAPDIVRNVEGNYNTIANLAEKAGILGTVWNAWQTSWVGGTYVAAQWAQQDGAFRNTYQTVANQVGLSRTGIRSTINVQMDRQVVDDRIISTAVIPYIRQRNVLVQVKALKPNTRFYPYFDNISVAEYCTPSSYLTYTLASSTAPDFETAKNAGVDATDTARIIDNIPTVTNADSYGNMCLNIGDRIQGGSSNATAVVVGKDRNSDTGVRRLHIVNIKGTFTTGETITAYGTGSGATATISGTMPTNKLQGDALTTNSVGELNFIFWIPNYDSIKFRTGVREFKLLDVSTSDGQSTSSSKVQYEATGTLQTRQQTINSVRNAVIAQESLEDSTVIVNASNRIIDSVQTVFAAPSGTDPLAQTFLVQSPGGAFLSKVDIFFATRDAGVPVTLEIREVVNGYPGKRILPFSKVTLKTEQVNAPIFGTTIDTTLYNTVTLDGATVAKYDKPTSFVFPSPVYVQDGEEYAIILSTDCINYKVWIAQMGDIIPDSNRAISEQPYNGVLFKSQNSSTWTANQDQDLKFTIYRCKFNTDVTGSVEFVNDVLSNNLIEADPFQTTSGTNKLRVWHENHGMFVDSKVVFDNVNKTVYQGTTATGTFTCADNDPTITGVGTSFNSILNPVGTAFIRASDNKVIGIIASITSNTSLELSSNASVTVASAVAFKLAPSINGIPVTEIYTSAAANAQIQHTISDVDLDSYCITASTNATTTGYSGGSRVRASSNIVYDMAIPSIQSQNFSDTNIDFTMKTTSGKSVDGAETPYTYGSYKGIVTNNNNMFFAPQVVASTVNQSSGKTVTLQATISSDNDALSPIIDSHRTSLITVSNKINKPSETNVNVSLIDNRTVFTGATGAFSFVNLGTAWAATTSKAVGDQVNYLGNLYTVTIAGTTSTAGPTHTAGLSVNGTATLLFSGKCTTITTSVAGVAALVLTIQVGKYITVSGSTTGGNDGTYLVTSVAGDGSTTGTITVSRTTNFTSESAISGTTVKLRTLFVDEIAPVGSSSVNKYVTKAITLSNPSNFFRIRYAGNIPQEADVLVYYKTSPVGSTLDFNRINWTLSDPDAAIVKVQNGDDTFIDVDYSEEGLSQFDVIAVKIVMQSTNSSAIPRIKDLRIIACA